MANRTIEAILRLSSKLGNMAAFRQLSGHLGEVDRKAKAVNRSQTLIARSAKGAYAATARLIAPVLTTAAAAGAVKNYAAMERQIGRIGDTADATVEQTERFSQRMRDLAADVRMPFQQVVDGVAELAASGKNLDEIGRLMPGLARAAHATGSDFKDIATTSDAIANSFGITADQMERAFDFLAYYGKAGKFELKEMASELPSLAPAFAALGYRGEEAVNKLAAALQTVRMETGTSGEAATSMMDVLTKMQSETVSNNFKKFGIDVRKAMATARRDGKDVLETFKNLAVQAVKGDLSKLPQLFTDKQMQIGMRALINNWKEYEALLSSSGDAAGTVAEGVKRFSNDTQASLDALSNSWDRLTASAGKAIAAMGGVAAMDSLSKGIEREMALRAALSEDGIDGFFDQSAYLLKEAAKRGFVAGRVETLENHLRWRGGHETDEHKKVVEAFGADLHRRQFGDGVTPRRPADKSGMPIEGPIPVFRPDPASLPPSSPASDYDGDWWRKQGIPVTQRLYPAGQSPRDAERDSMHALRSDPHGVADAIDEALANGGRKVAAALTDSAPAAGDDLGTAANARLQAGAVQAGNAMADTFLSRVRSGLPSIAASAGRSSGVNADLGRAGPAVEGAN